MNNPGLAAVTTAPNETANIPGPLSQTEEVPQATIETPVCLRLIGSIAAGGGFEGEVIPGTAARILSGARIPPGAETVLSDEFAHPEENV